MPPILREKSVKEVQSMKKTMVFLFAGILFFGFGSLLCYGGVPVIPDMPGWDRELPEGNNIAQFTLSGEDGTVQAGFFVSSLNYATEEEAREFETLLKNPPMGTEKIKILDVKEDNFRGRDWVVHHILSEIPGKDEENPEIFEAWKFLSREGNEVYSFEFITSPKLFEEFQPRFMECMERISFEEAPKTALTGMSQSEVTEDDFLDKLEGKGGDVSKKGSPSQGSDKMLSSPSLPVSQTPISPAQGLPGSSSMPSSKPQTSLPAPVQSVPGPPSSPVQVPPVSPLVPPAVPGGGTSSGVPQGLGAFAPPAPRPEVPSMMILELSPGAEWTPSTPMDPSISQYYLLPQQGINMAEMLVFEEDFDAPSTLQSYAQAITSQAPQLFASYQACQNWDIAINGVPVKVHEFFFAAQGNPNRLIGRAYIFLGGSRRGYVVLFDTMDTSYSYLAPKFDAVMRTLNLRPENPASPAPSFGQPSQPLPGTGGLPSFGTPSADPGVYADASKGLRVPLPSGARLTENLSQGGRYALSDGVELVLLNLSSSQEMENLAAQVASGKTFQGESLLSATGVQGRVGLYASTHPQTSVPYATLVARYPQASLLMILTLPRDNYARAGNWILPFLESVSLGGASGY